MGNAETTSSAAPSSHFAPSGGSAKPAGFTIPQRGEGGTSKDSKALDLDALRRAYELTGEAVASIRRRFGLSAWQFRKLRERGQWTPRDPIAKPGPLQGYKPIGEEALELRLNRLLAIGSAMLACKVAEEGMTETNARTLRELCRAQETMMRSKRTEKAAKAREKKNNDAGYDFRDDPAWLDAEINRRLDRLFDKGGVGQGHRRSQSGGKTGAAR
jgi:hypothetical protein